MTVSNQYYYVVCLLEIETVARHAHDKRKAPGAARHIGIIGVWVAAAEVERGVEDFGLRTPCMFHAHAQIFSDGRVVAAGRMLQ